MKNTHKVSLIMGNGFPIKSHKINRNKLCYCGSGEKIKNCHNTGTRYLYSQLSAEQRNKEIERMEREDRRKKVVLPC